MTSVDGTDSNQGSSNEVFRGFCEPCKTPGSEKEASNYCQDCDQLLCCSCTESHKGRKCFKKHTLQPAKGLSTSFSTTFGLCCVFCGCSQDNKVTLYCEDHDDIVCEVCQNANHSECKIVSVETKAERFDVSH